MTPPYVKREAIRLVIRAINVLLTAQGIDARVDGQIVVTRSNGHVIIAVPETATYPPPPPFTQV